jgi:hypothetical protein
MVRYSSPLRRIGFARVVVLTTAWLCGVQNLANTNAQEQAKSARPSTGVVVNQPGALQGYTLVFPLSSTKTYLVDMQGRVVHQWQSKYMAGQDAYLLENGNLLRSADLGENEAFFAGASKGGRIQEFTWDGQLVWDYKFHNESQLRHHAITRLPNGNILMIVWERKTPQQQIAAGVNSEFAGQRDILVDALIEVQPAGKTGGKIVWEWHMWDHLIQDFDNTKSNFGDVAEHPELVDANFARRAGGGFGGFGPPPPRRNNAPQKKAGNDNQKAKDDNLERLKGIGYIGQGTGRRFAGHFPDWTHVNAVAYNARLDQVMISVREFNEVWILDHSTTKREAASHQGGRCGKGGDLLYRWGNPQAYRSGTAKDQQLFAQHDTHWIPAGLPGEGHLLVFNNGGWPDHFYSSVDEVVLPVEADGRYTHESGTAFGPKAPIWTYAAPKKTDFFANFMSGAQRLPNGNTLIATGFGGSIFEVTPQKEIVWKYHVPVDMKPGRGTMMFFGGGGNPVFRAYRYAPDYAGLAKRDLTPGPTMEELQRQ